MDELVERSREVIEQGSKSFAAAARIFAPETRAGAYLLYAWCRHCDDRTDDQELGFDGGRLEAAEARTRVAELEAATRRALADEGDDCPPVYAGLAAVVRRFHIPHRYPLEHLEGFRMDVEGRDYRSLDDTLDYCYRVAGVVGLMMAHIMGVRDEATLDRACDLGLAFQLTNICRDVMDDAAVGRVYLPADWLAEVGVPPDEPANPRYRAGLVAVVRRTLDEAERYYDSAKLGIASLPGRSAWAIATARAVYRDIGRRVARRGGAAWEQRAATGRMRKLGLALGGGATVLAVKAASAMRSPAPRTGLWSRPTADDARAAIEKTPQPD